MSTPEGLAIRGAVATLATPDAPEAPRRLSTKASRAAAALSTAGTSTPNAITVGACGIVLAPRPMAGNRAVRVEMRNSSPPSLWLTTGAGRRRLDDRTFGRRRPPAPNNMMLHRGGGGLGLTLCPFLVPCTKCIQNVNVKKTGDGELGVRRTSPTRAFRDCVLR